MATAATALTLSWSATASPHDQGQQQRLPRRTIAARRRFFGAANVDGDGRLRRDRIVPVLVRSQQLRHGHRRPGRAAGRLGAPRHLLRLRARRGRRPGRLGPVPRPHRPRALRPRRRRPPTVTDAVDTLSHRGDQEGGALAHRFRYRDFTLVWHDSAGPLRDKAPNAHREMRRRGRRPDVQLGSIQGFGQYTNGLRDPMWYVDALRPRVFVPGHHDNWQPPASSPASSYEGRLREALAALPGESPRLRMLRDPDDYVNPGRLTFDPGR